MGTKLTIDYVGKKIHMLTIVKKSHQKFGTNFWECLCECGNRYIASSSVLGAGKQKSCGCYKKRKGIKSTYWKGEGDISGSYYANLKSQAKFRKLEFNLTLKWMWNLFVEQNKKCALSGIDLMFNIGSYQSQTHNKGTASLDRIDPSAGYIIGNVQWVHKDINFMKQELSQEKFIELCKKVTEHNKNKEIAGGRKDYKVDCLAVEHSNWEPTWK